MKKENLNLLENKKVIQWCYEGVTDVSLKNTESEKKLKIGETFNTTEGTILVYIGNNHVWFHVGKKLYNLFKDLKGQTATICGGSMEECLLDLEITAKSMGVNINRDYRYIYSASHCPIK